MDCLLRHPTGWFNGVLKIEVFRARSTPIHPILAATRPSSSITSVPTSWCRTLCSILNPMQRSVDHMRLCVSLPPRCVGHTRQATHHRQSPPPVQQMFSKFKLLFYITLCFSLLLCFLLWVLASIWFLAVPTLQLSLHSDGCFTHIGLFMEFLCVSNRLVWPRNRLGLPLILFELWVITIASCSVLLDRIQYCPYFSTVFYHLGYVVGEFIPFSFFGSPSSSSFRIRNGKDLPL